MTARCLGYLVLLVLGIGKAEASSLATLTCPDSYGPMVFLLNLDTYMVVKAIDKNFGRERIMFSNVPISATETDLIWIWKNGHTDLGRGPIQGVIRTYTLDRSTLEMRIDVRIGSELDRFEKRCYLSRRLL